MEIKGISKIIVQRPIPGVNTSIVKPGLIYNRYKVSFGKRIIKSIEMIKGYAFC